MESCGPKIARAAAGEIAWTELVQFLSFFSKVPLYIFSAPMPSRPQVAYRVTISALPSRAYFSLIPLIAFLMSSPKIWGADPDPHARDKSALVITSTNALTDEQQWEYPRVAKVGNLSGHVAMLQLRNIPEGKDYVAEFSLSDPDGVSIALTNATQTFTAKGPHRNVPVPFFPPYEKQKSGKWNWSAKVDGGVGTFSASVMVEPLTPQEERGLKMYEQAREAALLVFANYWVGVIPPKESESVSENAKPPKADFFTAITAEDFEAERDSERAQQELEELNKKAEKLKEEKEAARVVANQRNDRQRLFHFQATHPEWNVTYMLQGNYSAAPKPRSYVEVDGDLAKIPQLEQKIRARIRPNKVVKIVSYVEVSGLTPLRSVSVPYLTKADELNGITYKAESMLGFEVYRLYHPESGWTEWYDAAYVPDHLAAPFARTFGTFLNSGKFPNLRFSLLQRNGRWYVTTDGGQMFVDGQKLENAGATEQMGQGFAPKKETILEFLRTGKRPLDTENSIAETLRKNPKELEAQVKDTIELARGKPMHYAGKQQQN
jgi:hypothetical protein